MDDDPGVSGGGKIVREGAFHEVDPVIRMEFLQAERDLVLPEHQLGVGQVISFR
jgi:hypothetical protein